MTDEDLKKITKAFDERLKPLLGEVSRIRIEISELKSTQFRNYTELSRIGKDMARVDSLLETINEELSSHTVKLDNHTGALMEIESILNGYADMYKMNKDDLSKYEKRISKLENKLGIIVPQN